MLGRGASVTSLSRFERPTNLKPPPLPEDTHLPWLMFGCGTLLS
jgi:hypothetical protein